MGATISSSTYPIQDPTSKLYRLTIEGKELECIEILPFNSDYNFYYSTESDIDGLKVIQEQIKSIGSKKYSDIPKDLFCKAMDYSARGLTNKFIYKTNDNTRFFMLAPKDKVDSMNDLIKNEMFCITSLYLQPENYEYLYDNIVTREKNNETIENIADELRNYVLIFSQYITIDIDPYDSEIFSSNSFFNSSKTEIKIPKKTNYLMYFIILLLIIIIAYIIYKNFFMKENK